MLQSPRIDIFTSRGVVRVMPFKTSRIRGGIIILSRGKTAVWEHGNPFQVVPAEFLEVAVDRGNPMEAFPLGGQRIGAGFPMIDAVLADITDLSLIHI